MKNKGVCQLATFLHRDYKCGECSNCKKYFKKIKKTIRGNYER